MKVLASALLLLSCLAADCARADDLAERASLKGLDSLRLVISDLGPKIEGQGLKKQDLQTALEARLRAGGVTLLGANERARGTPALHLSLNLAPADDGETAFVYSLDLALSQEVRLVRAPNIRVLSPTWRGAGSVGVVDADRLGTLSEACQQAVDAFLAAFREANAAK